MSPDEKFIVELVEALAETKLEALVVGATAAILQGAPLMTRDIDLLVRDTPKNRSKINDLCKLLAAHQRQLELAPVVTLIGAAVPVDLLFDRMAGGLSFELVKSRAVHVDVGRRVAKVASLEDVIASKQAAGRAKDLAQLPILLDTLKVIRELAKKR